MWGLLCICQAFSPWVNSVTVLNKLIFLKNAVRYYSRQSQPGADFCEWYGACLWHVPESFPGRETARSYSVCSGLQFVVQRSGRLGKAVLILGFVRNLVYDFDQGLIPSLGQNMNVQGLKLKCTENVDKLSPAEDSGAYREKHRNPAVTGGQGSSCSSWLTYKLLPG